MIGSMRGQPAHFRETGAACRAAAARAVHSVTAEGCSLSRAIDTAFRAAPEVPLGLLCELAYGTLRYLPRLALFLERLLHKPLPANDQGVRALLLVGLYQLDHLDTPAHVAVSNTVEAARLLGAPWACNLVNAVLRGFHRQRPTLRLEVDANLVGKYAHPAWLLEAIRAEHPNDWQEILNANNQRPPMTLRVNAAKVSRDEYLEMLAQAGMPAVASRHASTGIHLLTPVNVGLLPGFTEGSVSVQDEAAQFAAPLLDARPGHRVLDACSAPGGKTAHLLEQQPALAELVALDSDPARVVRLNATLQRLGLAATVVTANALEPAHWWDGSRFDRILLDAPCSAVGVIRRHPDIKTLRRASDIEALATAQRDLLAALWPLLVPGGKLLYVTCSILTAENDRVIEGLVSVHPDAHPVPVDAAWGRCGKYGRQILPGESNMDGFFYALLAKR